MLQLDRPVAAVLKTLARGGILGGLDLSGYYPELGSALLVCATQTSCPPRSSAKHVMVPGAGKETSPNCSAIRAPLFLSPNLNRFCAKRTPLQSSCMNGRSPAEGANSPALLSSASIATPVLVLRKSHSKSVCKTTDRERCLFAIFKERTAAPNCTKNNLYFKPYRLSRRASRVSRPSGCLACQSQPLSAHYPPAQGTHGGGYAHSAAFGFSR